MFKDCAVATIVIQGNGFSSVDDIRVLTRTQLFDEVGTVVEDVTYEVTDNDDKLSVTQATMLAAVVGGTNLSA